MKRVLLLAVVLLGSTWSNASAQTTDAGYADALTPSLASVARTMHVTIRRNIVEAVEAIPAREYSFRPTPETRTFAQLIGHVINANWFFCSQAKQEPPPNSVNYETLTDKAALVKAMHDVMSYCDGAYETTTDANFNQAVQMQAGVGMGPASTVRGAILTFNNAHDNEHYGNIVVYMRLKGSYASVDRTGGSCAQEIVADASLPIPPVPPNSVSGLLRQVERKRRDKEAFHWWPTQDLPRWHSCAQAAACAGVKTARSAPPEAAAGP